MTLPIAFTATPHDSGTDNADAQDAFSQVATVTDANFEKINAWWRAQGARYTRSDQIVPAPADLIPGGSTPVDFAPATWPAASIVLPARVGTLLVGLGANVDFHGSSSGTYGAVTMRVSGATSYGVPSSASVMAMHTSGSAMSVLVAIPAAQLTPAGTVVITPQYIYSSPAAAPRFRIGDGSIWAVALT